MPDDILDKILKKAGISLPSPSKPKTGGDDSIARVLDDEFSNLGYPSTARLSMLADVGRENAYNRDTIFKGHRDPANNKYNRGIISWQGSRQIELEDFLEKQGVRGKGDDDELRGMARFMDKELQRDYPNVHAKLKAPKNTREASEALRQYIKYVPSAPYNSPDDEFVVKNNADWARKVKAWGLAQGDRPSASFDEIMADVLGTKNRAADEMVGKGRRGTQRPSPTLPAELPVGAVLPPVTAEQPIGQEVFTPPTPSPAPTPEQIERAAKMGVDVEGIVDADIENAKIAAEERQQPSAVSRQPLAAGTPQQPTAPPDKTFTAQVDPGEGEPSPERDESVFRQAIDQWAQSTFGRPLNKMELDALSEYQRATRKGFVFEDNDLSKPASAKAGTYTIDGPTATEYQQFLEANQERFAEERTEHLKEFLAAGGVLDNDARAQFRNLGFTDQEMDSLMGLREDATYLPNEFTQAVEARKQEYQNLIDLYRDAPDDDTRMNAVSYARRAMGWITPGKAADEVGDYYALKSEKLRELGGTDASSTSNERMIRGAQRTAMSPEAEKWADTERDAELQSYLVQTIGKYGTASNRLAVRRQEAMAEQARKHRVAQMSWPEYVGRTAKDGTLNIVKSALSIAISSTLRGVALGAKSLDDLWNPGLTQADRDRASGRMPRRVSEYQTYKWGETIDAMLDYALPTSKDMQQEFLAGKLPQGLGSTLGMAIGGLSKTPRIAIATLSSLQMGGDSYKEAIEQGATEDQAQMFGLLSAPLGVTEIFGIGNAIVRLNKGTGSTVWRKMFREAWNAGKREAPEELLQEGFQTTAQNIIGRLTYDPDREADKNLYEDLLVAGIAAPLASGGVSILNVARNRHAINNLIKQEQANGVIIKSYGEGELYVFDQRVPVTPELAPMVERYNFSRNGILEIQAQIEALQKAGRHATTPEETAPFLKNIWALKRELNALQTRQVQVSKDIAERSGVGLLDGTVGDTLIPSAEDIAAAKYPVPSVEDITETQKEGQIDGEMSQFEPEKVGQISEKVPINEPENRVKVGEEIPINETTLPQPAAPLDVSPAEQISAPITDNTGKGGESAATPTPEKPAVKTKPAAAAPRPPINTLAFAKREKPAEVAPESADKVIESVAPEIESPKRAPMHDAFISISQDIKRHKDYSPRGIFGESRPKDPSPDARAFADAVEKHIYEGNRATDLMRQDYNLTVGKGKKAKPVTTLDEFHQANPQHKDWSMEDWQTAFQPYMDEGSRRINALWEKPPKAVVDAYAKLQTPAKPLVEKPVVGESKAPWQMTPEAYAEYAHSQQRHPRTKKPTREDRIASGGLHERAVREAIADGKPVPPEVLKDYPDLAPKPEKPPRAEKPTASEEPKEAQPTKSTSDLFREKLAKLKAEQEKPATDEDDGFAELDKAMGLTPKSMKSVLPETEQPFDDAQYNNVLKPIFEKIVARFEAKTADEQMETFLRKLNERYDIDAIAKLEPYVVRFMDAAVSAETEKKTAALQKDLAALMLKFVTGAALKQTITVTDHDPDGRKLTRQTTVEKRQNEIAAKNKMLENLVRCLHA